MNRRGKGEIPKDEETEDISLIDEVIDEKDISFNLSYIDRINDFIARNDLLESSPMYYLYKYDNAQAGNTKSFIAKFTEVEPPDEDTIGKRFGSGRYLICVAIPACTKAPKGFMRAYNIKIHQYYDSLRIQPSGAPVQPTTIIQQPGNSLTETISVIGQLVAVIAPLLQQKNNNTPDISEMLFRNFEVTSEVLKKSMLENVKAQGELQRKLLQNDESSDMGNTTAEDEPGILEQLKPLLVEWLPKLMGDNQQAKAVQTVVKMTPEFKRIVKNKEDYRRLVMFLDQEKGTDITNKILANLGLKR